MIRNRSGRRYGRWGNCWSGDGDRWEHRWRVGMFREGQAFRLIGFQKFPHLLDAMRIQIVVHGFLHVFPSETTMKRDFWSLIRRVLQCTEPGTFQRTIISVWHRDILDTYWGGAIARPAVDSAEYQDVISIPCVFIYDPGIKA